MLSFVRRAIPLGLRRRVRQTVDALGRDASAAELARLRSRMFADPPCTTGLEPVLDFSVRIADGPNFYMQYKDEFVRRIYDFQADKPDPFIIDGGSNIGMSILYFKHLYPAARIIGFEPDPYIFGLLQENVYRNGLQDVTLVNAGLAGETGTVTFLPDGGAGGHIAPGDRAIQVRMERLSSYLTEPVDFLKLNIEGQELPVLEEAVASGRITQVRQLVLEYHGWPQGDQCLGDVLNLLDQHGFRYLLHDFDSETCGKSKPPFRLTSETTWFCLVYARNMRL